MLVDHHALQATPSVLFHHSLHQSTGLSFGSRTHLNSPTSVMQHMCVCTHVCVLGCVCMCIKNFVCACMCACLGKGRISISTREHMQCKPSIVHVSGRADRPEHLAHPASGNTRGTDTVAPQLPVLAHTLPQLPPRTHDTRHAHTAAPLAPPSGYTHLRNLSLSLCVCVCVSV